MSTSEKARKHAERHAHCSCGARPRGNGGKASHFAAHERKGDGHRMIHPTEWERRFGCNCAELAVAAIIPPPRPGTHFLDCRTQAKGHTR